MKKTLLLFVLQIVTIQSANSQTWMCDIKPGVKLFQTSFFKSTLYEKKNETEIVFDYLDKRQQSNLCFEPELFMDFYKLNKKWHFGFGISTHNWTSKSFMSGSYYVNDNTADEDTTFQSRVDMELRAKNFQMMLTGTRQINFGKKISESLSSNLIIGLGFNRLYPKNALSEYVNFPNEDYPLNYSTEVYKHLYGSKFSNNLSLALLLKYELTFLNRTKGSDLFNLTISYTQGFSNLNSILITAQSSEVRVYLETKSLGSGLRIGITKTLPFQQVK
jgi:hypothetical protein